MEPGRLADEFALRLPNAVFGALTVIPLFLLTAAFFDRWTGLIAAALWAVGVNAITYNRIGKEDTLLVFFMLFAFYFYLRAKQTDTRDGPRRKRNYLLGGISFGLMLASKYFPHYFGLNQLYHHNFHVRKRKPGEPSGKTPGLLPGDAGCFSGGQSAGAVAAGLVVPERVHGREAVGSYGLSLRRSPLQK